MDITKSFDRYVIQARIVPALIVCFPLASLVVVWMPEEEFGKRLLSGMASLVLLSLVAQLGRDAGKQREPQLFEKWNGKPSVRKLRHRDTDVQWITLERLRSQLATNVGIPCPTKAEEESDAAAADEVYAAYVDHLREATRGDKILLAENISYGFRRNLWGMRSAGLSVAIVGTIGAGIAAEWHWMTDAMAVPAIAMILNATLTSIWLLRVTEPWVKVTADAYADRLVRAFLVNTEVKSDKAA